MTSQQVQSDKSLKVVLAAMCLYPGMMQCNSSPPPSDGAFLERIIVLRVYEIEDPIPCGRL